MAIQPLPHSIPTKLPPAKLYLDDIVEILQILTESSDECHVSFVAGKSKCDSLDDLKGLGGRATHFVVNISSSGKHQTLELTTSATRIHIYEIGDQLPAWSKWVNVAAIFEKRKLRLKSAVRSLASWIFAGLWLLTIAAWMFTPQAIKPVSIHELPRLATGMAVAIAVAYYVVCSHSVVYLRYPHKAGVGRWLEDHKPEIIVGAICIVVGTVTSQVLARVWK